MKAIGNLLSLALLGTLVTGCKGEPVGLMPRAEDGSPQPLFATRPVGPVTIQTIIDFAELPFHGEFVVIEGSALLGCSEGTFVDHWATGFPSPAAIRKEFTCTASGTGSFTVNFRPGPVPGPGIANGHWNVLAGNDDFANLRAEGDFSLDFIDFQTLTGQETITGTIHFDP
jgi:hypothetical protein